MKSVYVLAISVFSTGILVVSVLFIAMFTNEPVHNYSQEAHADWPHLDIDELIEKADLIAYVSSETAKTKYVQLADDSSIEAQFTDLEIQKVLKGESSNQVVLNQALDYVEADKSYLVFLSKGDDGLYYELSGESIIPENNHKFMSHIDGLSGDFSLNEIDSKVKQVIIKHKK